MKLVLKDPAGFQEEHCSISVHDKPCLDSSWHYHAQFELLYNARGSGIRFVGDSVSEFSPGDLVLVGPYLPHLWRNDSSYYEDGATKNVRTIVLKFTRGFIGNDTFENPAFSDVKKLLSRSKYGISFGNRTSKALHQDFLQIVDLPEHEQLIQLLSLLCRLANSPEQEVLSSADMRQYKDQHSDRLTQVVRHISDHYADDISLQDIADVACMTTNSFCRFFKKKTNKSFTQFLNEVRIKNAARILVQNTVPVSEAGYKVGYKSLTNFYKQFRQVMGCSPKAYLDKM
ncbi:MAG: AraC family transcriptional regulator [Saprospiraceae bacterium]|nr:AraC family transcriptional regulator [Saprospiraceae bacterium]